MKKIFTYSRFCLLALLALSTASCEKEKLSEVITATDGAKVSLALPNMIEVAGGTNYTLDNSQLVVPVTVEFDGSSTKAFTVQTTVNTDTVATLIANKVLPEGTIAMEEGKFSIPPVLNIAYGVKSVTFDVNVSRTFMELYYGKDIAFVVKMADAAKGNSIVASKSSTIIVIKTGLTIDPNAVHYVKFASTETILNFPKAGTDPGFSTGSQDLTIPLPLLLTGEAGSAFNVDVIKDDAVVNAAIAAGKLSGVSLLDQSQFSIINTGSKGVFDEGKNQTSVTLSMRQDALRFSYGKQALGLTLKNPSRWQLGKENISVIIVMDVAYYKRASFNAAPFAINGGVGTVSDFIPASNYDLGGEGVAYHDNGGRDGGQFRRPDQVDISDNNITVGWTGDGEWLSYTVDVKEAGKYSLNSIIGAPGTDGRYSVFFGIDNVTNVLSSRKTAGSYGDQRPNYSLVNLKAGVQVMRFFMDRGAYDVRGYQFTKLNKYDGNYSVTGTVSSYNKDVLEESKSGTIVAGKSRALVTAGANNRIQLIPIYKDGSDVVDHSDLTYLTIDPITNLVTVSSEVNGDVKPIGGGVNIYDPVTKTFTVNFEWKNGDFRGSTSLTLKFTSNR